MIIGILYVGVLMHINEITKVLKAFLIPKCFSDYKQYCKRSSIKISRICQQVLQLVRSKSLSVFKQGCQMQYLTDDVIVSSAEDEETFVSIQGNVQLICDEEIQSIVLTCIDEGEKNVVPGLLKIVIFFYQANILFKIYTWSKSGRSIHALQESISTLFNLRTDGTFTQDLYWCPINNLKPVSKVLLKSLFIIYLFLLLLLVFTLYKAGRLLKIVKDTSPFSSRILCCILRLVFISYSGITVTCFSLLSCVQLGYFGKVLFIDGSISCYKWWQMIVIFVVCWWIVPFPVTIYASFKLLHNNRLSAAKLLLCLLFPLPALCYWIYTCYKTPRKGLEPVELLTQDVQDVLQIMKGPFKKMKAK